MLHSAAEQRILGSCCQHRCPNDDKGILMGAVLISVLESRGLEHLAASCGPQHDDRTAIASLLRSLAQAYGDVNQLGWSARTLLTLDHSARVNGLFTTTAIANKIITDAMNRFKRIITDGSSVLSGSQRTCTMMNGTDESSMRLASQVCAPLLTLLLPLATLLVFNTVGSCASYQSVCRR